MVELHWKHHQPYDPLAIYCIYTVKWASLKCFRPLKHFPFCHFHVLLFKSIQCSVFFCGNSWAIGIKVYQPKIRQRRCRHFDTRIKCTFWNAVENAHFLHVENEWNDKLKRKANIYFYIASKRVENVKLANFRVWLNQSNSDWRLNVSIVQRWDNLV